MSYFAEIPLVVSFYTKGTLYEKEAEKFVASCTHFQIVYEIDAVEDLGSWEANCLMKPRFLQQKMCQHARPLLWVDIDACFKQAMAFEEFMFSDIAILRYVEKDLRFMVAGGTVFVNATEFGKQALDLWCHYAYEIAKQQIVPFGDQLSLALLFRSSFPGQIALLPQSYCAIFDHPCKEPVVIEHHQASRRAR